MRLYPLHTRSGGPPSSHPGTPPFDGWVKTLPSSDLPKIIRSFGTENKLRTFLQFPKHETKRSKVPTTSSPPPVEAIRTI